MLKGYVDVDMIDDIRSMQKFVALSTIMDEYVEPTKVPRRFCR